MNIVDWFDPKNLDHLRAYNHLRNYGEWPVGFITENIEFPVNWPILLLAKIANEYINERLMIKGKGDRSMSTRSLTIFKDGEEEIVVMYHHYDGYLKGYGKELAEFLQDMVLTCGIPLEKDAPGKFANGMNCLAAQVVSHFKNHDVGNVYLWPAGKRDIGEDYIYEVNGKEGEEVIITAMKSYGNNEVLVSGKASEVLKQINNMT